MKKLTERQKVALSKLSREWQSSYRLKESRNTLEALVRNGFAKKKTGIGCYYSPATCIEYALKKLSAAETEQTSS